MATPLATPVASGNMALAQSDHERIQGPARTGTMYVCQLLF